jgi:hypothetical protein
MNITVNAAAMCHCALACMEAVMAARCLLDDGVAEWTGVLLIFRLVSEEVESKHTRAGACCSFSLVTRHRLRASAGPNAQFFCSSKSIVLEIKSSHQQPWKARPYNVSAQRRQTMRPQNNERQISPISNALSSPRKVLRGHPYHQ